MTEKQFTIDVETENYENAYFENDKFLCYEDDYDAILNRLNELAEENKLYKERISLLSSLLDLADAIIDTSDNEKAKQVWDNKNEQTEKEWERILND